MNSIVLTGLFTVAAAAIGGLLTFLGTKSKDRERKLQSDNKKLRVELLEVYRDLQELWESENNLIQLAGISKIEARKERAISKKAEPAKIAQRIRELDSQIKAS